MLLPFEDAPPSIRGQLSETLRGLASERVLIGTSSWKYEGWLDQIYSRERYLSRGRFSKKRFEAECLREYAETFPIVCGDFSFYQFPSPDYWSKLFHSAPDSLRFALKVPEDVTVKVFPTHPRYGPRGGMLNETFLNAEMFQVMFAEPLEPFRERIAALIFEFGAFSHATYPGVEEFIADLAPFLGALPDSFRYAVEIRNPEFLDPLYFSCLREHGVAHVFNAWTRMPEIGVQMRVRDSLTADFTVTRALLRRGRAYEDAVKMFTPYDRVQDENPPTRESLRELIRQAKEKRQAAYVFVNNRLEGNAPATIQAVVNE
jgi:uncharacterized protein YecE (DUF72 family)